MIIHPRVLLSASCLMWACSDGAGAAVDGGRGHADAAPDGAPSTSADAAAVGDAHTGDGLDAGAGADAGVTSADASSGRAVSLPPANGGLDYQLGGAYAPPTGVTIVSRDRSAAPAPGLYNVCYINGFQAQQEENDFWLTQHPGLVLRDTAGKPVVDPDWNEMLLDVGSSDKRAQLAAITALFIASCGSAGFDAVEIDNLDSYTRSGGRLQMDDAVAFMALLSAEAHRHGLAIAQKNASELVPRKAEMGTDFVVAEECSRYDECDAYIAAYPEHVLMIEYRRADFSKGCTNYPAYSIVLRDLDLVPKGTSGYLFDGC